MCHEIKINVRSTSTFMGYENPITLCVPHEKPDSCASIILIGNEIIPDPSNNKTCTAISALL